MVDWERDGMKLNIEPETGKSARSLQNIFIIMQKRKDYGSVCILKYYLITKSFSFAVLSTSLSALLYNSILITKCLVWWLKCNQNGIHLSQYLAMSRYTIPAVINDNWTYKMTRYFHHHLFHLNDQAIIYTYVEIKSKELQTILTWI